MKILFDKEGRQYKICLRPSLPSLRVSNLLFLGLLVRSVPAVFGHLRLLSLPGGFRGEVATLQPAGERPGVAVGESVLLQFGGLEESFPTDVADVFPKVLAAVY